ncbi:MAG: hypothetical protein NXI31_11515 [bacterium]|nr:hypothetical protein [bacterium]
MANPCSLFLALGFLGSAVAAPAVLPTGTPCFAMVHWQETTDDEGRVHEVIWVSCSLGSDCPGSDCEVKDGTDGSGNGFASCGCLTAPGKGLSECQAVLHWDGPVRKDPNHGVAPVNPNSPWDCNSTSAGACGTSMDCANADVPTKDNPDSRNACSCR